MIKDNATTAPTRKHRRTDEIPTVTRTPVYQTDAGSKTRPRFMLGVGDVVTTRRTRRQYQVVEMGASGPVFRYLQPQEDGTSKLYGPTMALNPRRYTYPGGPAIVTMVFDHQAAAPTH